MQNDSTKPERYPGFEADASRLLALWNRFKAENRKVSQLSFGSQYGIGTQGMVWQYLHGRTPLNLTAATKFAEGLQCRVADISPYLAQLAERASELGADRAPAAREPALPNYLSPEQTKVLRLWMELTRQQKDRMLVTLEDEAKSSRAKGQQRLDRVIKELAGKGAK